MALKEIKLRLKGTSPLLMHNGDLANPRNFFAREMKKISSRRNKTDEDLDQLSEAEYQGGLYFDDEMGPVLPGEMFEASIRDGAKLSKNGKKVMQGVKVEPLKVKLEYKGPRTREELWADENFSDTRMVKIQRNKVMRTRPRFNQWSVTVPVMYESTIIEEHEVLKAIEAAGERLGLGDYRPRYGRFVVETVNGRPYGEAN